jgi:hypothetical protein
LVGTAVGASKDRTFPDRKEHIIELSEAWHGAEQALLADERSHLLEAAGMALGTVRAQLRAEIAELRAELTTLKTANVVELKRRDTA